MSNLQVIIHWPYALRSPCQKSTKTHNQSRRNWNYFLKKKKNKKKKIKIKTCSVIFYKISKKKFSNFDVTCFMDSRMLKQIEKGKFWLNKRKRN